MQKAEAASFCVTTSHHNANCRARTTQFQLYQLYSLLNSLNRNRNRTKFVSPVVEFDGTGRCCWDYLFRSIQNSNPWQEIARFSLLEAITHRVITLLNILYCICVVTLWTNIRRDFFRFNFAYFRRREHARTLIGLKQYPSA